MSRLMNLLAEQRPRERLLAKGAPALRDEELLALVLGTGRGSGEDALEMADRLLAELGGVTALALADARALRRLIGVGPVKAARIRAAIELARRAVGPGQGSPPEQPAESKVPPEPPEPPESPEPPDPLEEAVRRLRGRVPTGERAILAWRVGEPGGAITLALGDGIGKATPVGALLVRLLGEGPGPWSLAAVRPGGEPRDGERGAAERLGQAAELVGVALEQVLVIGGRRHWLLHGGVGGASQGET